MPKRKQKRKNNNKPAIKKPLYLYPVVWCVTECKVIAFSRDPLKVKSGKNRFKVVDKVNIKQWTECVFESEEYTINFEQYIDGDVVLCPKCHKPVDFRAFPSSTLPEFNK